MFAELLPFFLIGVILLQAIALVIFTAMVLRERQKSNETHAKETVVLVKQMMAFVSERPFVEIPKGSAIREPLSVRAGLDDTEEGLLAPSNRQRDLLDHYKGVPG